MESDLDELAQPPANIVLTGFMGTGKSVAGHILARETGREFVDTDELIVELAGKPVADIFFDSGEATFRAYERHVARELSKRSNLVISTGGRLMLDPLNALLLNQQAIVFCLTATAEEILARTEADLTSRPLLDFDEPARRIEKLLLERKAGYNQYLQVDTGGRSIQEVAQEMLEVSNQLVEENRWQTRLTSRIPVQHPEGSYEVAIGRKLLTSLTDYIDLNHPVAMITDTNVAEHYVNSLEDVDLIATIVTPAGEEYKRLETVRSIYDQLLQVGMDRQGTIITLGGGVVGDMGGFAASTYMRGIRLIQCPTSLLAMVDASVGGKTGVDMPQGKNLVGSFKQPEAVIADIDTLQTLPGAEILSGMAEVVKAGIIASADLLDSIEDLAPRLSRAAVYNNQNLPLADFHALVVESILIKRDVVEVDPFERDERMLLNLGHTFAHAIEKSSSYSIRHGEAVSMGLVACAKLSSFLYYCDSDIPERIEAILSKLNLPIRIPAELTTDRLLENMKSDKKVKSGERRFVLIRDIGDVFVETGVPEPAVHSVLDELRRQDK
jgi:3-dehydroquinate synthase